MMRLRGAARSVEAGGTPPAPERVEPKHSHLESIVYDWPDLLRVLALSVLVAALGIWLAYQMPLAIRPVVLVLAWLAAMAALARFHCDSGGIVWRRGDLYARRWALRGGRAEGVAAVLRPVLAWVACEESQGELHPMLRDPAVLAKNRIVLIVFDGGEAGVERGGTRTRDLPCAIHVPFRAGYYKEVVLHLGLSAALPTHRGRGIGSAIAINTALAFLTYITTSLVIADLSTSATGLHLSCDLAHDAYPNFRFCNRGPSGWHVDVAKFLFAKHRNDMGISRSAILDEQTFVVRGSKDGGNWDPVGDIAWAGPPPRRCLDFLRRNLRARDDLLRLFRVRVGGLVGRAILASSARARTAYVVVVLLMTSARLMVLAVLGRVDGMHSVALSTMFWLGIQVKVEGASESDLTPRGSGATAALWISNHFTLFDYTVLHMVSRQVLACLVKHDISGEVPVLGPIASTFLFDFMGCVPYVRGSKGSGQEARQVIARQLKQHNPILVFPEGTGTECGPPLPFRRGALVCAYEVNAPVQPCTLWYSEPIGLAPESPTLAQLSEMVRRPMQCVARLGPLIWPADFEDANAFAAAVEDRVRRDFDEISRAAGCL